MVFTFKLSGPNGYSNSQDVRDGQTVTWNNLQPGDYLLTEENVGSEWTVSISNDGSATITGDDLVNLVVTNTHGTPTTPCPVEKFVIDGGLHSTCDIDAPVIQLELWAFYVPTSKEKDGMPRDADGNIMPDWDQGWLRNAVPLIPGWSFEAVRDLLWAKAEEQGYDYQYYTEVTFNEETGISSTRVTWRDLINWTGATTINGVRVEAVDPGRPGCPEWYTIHAMAYLTTCTDDVKVFKTVDWNGQNVDETAQYTIVISGTTVNHYAEQTVDFDGGEIIFKGLPHGSYIVYEKNSGDNWMVSITNDGNITLDGSKPPVIEVHNKRVPWEPDGAIGDGKPFTQAPDGDYVRIGVYYYTLTTTCATDTEGNLILPDQGFIDCNGNIRGHKFQGGIQTDLSGDIDVRKDGVISTLHTRNHRTVKIGSAMTSQNTIGACERKDGKFTGNVEIADLTAE